MSKSTYSTFILLGALFLCISSLSAQVSESIPTPRQLEQLDDSTHPDKLKLVGKWHVKGLSPIYSFDASKLKKKKVEQAVKEVTKRLQDKFDGMELDLKSDNVAIKSFKGEKESLGFYKLKDDKLYLHELGPGTSLFGYDFKKSNLILKINIPTDSFDLHMAIEFKKVN